MSIAKLPQLIPPFRFAMVEENLFRGGYPKPRNKRFLKRLQLKAILSLIPDKLMPEMQQFCEENNIQLIHLNVDKMKEDNIPLTYNKTLMALQFIIDPVNHPLYVHCLDGANVTGLVIACLRKLQMWSNSSAMNEYARHLHTNVISSEEFEFVENFKNFEVTIPITLPQWLWGGQVKFRKHTSLRLKFLNSEMMTEEERELKNLKEKKEKEKEDYYKKRKNDLLDNLFEPTSPVVSRHRPGTNNAVVGGNNNNTINSLSIASNNSNTTPPLPKPTATMIDDPIVNPPQSRSKKEIESTKDSYLVDVDVDVDGVMMDGLDQVEYLKRNVANSSNARFYMNLDDYNMLLTDEELAEIYEAEKGTRFTTETISRTLEALALEGLTDL
ncbi:hypothetical protein G6F70_005133 [Rhizopus microsporus]|uniref:Tyrosine-protein phosphatase domain-containing protein n=2 Tax=Rhizopus TaxID=4842 RepID=A0A367K7J3_RHIAZ|nr:hypothetical protein G6F71_003266 [Rhizopus microsporus]RCH97811.1 hypothetical protein CU097_010803 [Rhizopus azygosporus]KAG1199213.1 hypothetical protein G6F70_005133 [Rhizopus microsporus]KAG1211012.1 hypothetical protein G6F69_004973 [Rhizopus microsporus]KAG1232829.1 hypothetical protein G6F67_004728 [Rhizopus microsporus]